MFVQSRKVQLADVRIVVDDRECLLSDGVVDLETILKIVAAPMDGFVLRLDGGVARAFDPEIPLCSEDLAEAHFRVFPEGAPFPLFVDDENWIWGSNTMTADDVLAVVGRGIADALVFEGEDRPLDAKEPIDLAVASPPRLRTVRWMVAGVADEGD